MAITLDQDNSHTAIAVAFALRDWCIFVDVKKLLSDLPADLRLLNCNRCAGVGATLANRLDALHIFSRCRLLLISDNRPANSWLSLSDRLHAQLIDAKHLPHDVIRYMRPLVDEFSAYIDELQHTGGYSYSQVTLPRFF